MGAPLLLSATVIAGFVCPVAIGAAHAQGLTVLPVSIQMAPGQMAAALTVINQSESETSFQIRAFSWNQQADGDQLTATTELLASPPLGTIAAGATQVVRLVLRRPPEGREATYRILLDQIPPAAAPGTVRIALRLSIPLFAEPSTRVAANIQWRVTNSGRQAYLEAVNDGNRHETVRDIALASHDGAVAKVETNVSPYILAGATRRWRIVPSGSVVVPGAQARLTAQVDSGTINQTVPVVAGQ